MKAKRLIMLSVVALALVIGALIPLAPVEAQSMWTRFRSVLIDHDLDVNGDADVDGTLNADAIDIDGALQLDSTLTVGTAGSGYDVTFQSGTSGDLFLWDASEEGLYITGTAGQDALDIVDGNVDIADNMSIDGSITDSDSAVTFADNVIVDGAADANQLTVQGNGTQTNSLLVLEQSDGTDKLTVSNQGQVVFSPEADSDGANYDEWITITGDMTGTGTKDRNYGLLIEMTRPAGQELGSGDHDEAGLKIRVDTEAVTTTAGTVLRAIDAESKADNPGGTVTNLFGASVTAKSDSSAGDVGTMVALTTNSQANAQVTAEMGAADLRLFRQSATEPTSEYVLKVRNSSTTGSGADAGIYLLSDYGSSSTTDSMDYGIDMASAQINTADIRLENGETISNGTDTAIVLGGFLALTEGAVIDLAAGGTITPVASYQPITTSEGGSCTTSTSTAIADGAVAGTILILCNEDAQDIVIDDGANTDIGGNVTLTGGAGDCVSLIWNGSDWNKISTHADN